MVYHLQNNLKSAHSTYESKVIIHVTTSRRDFWGWSVFFAPLSSPPPPSPVTTTNTTTSTTFVTVTTAALQTNSDHHQPQQKHSQSRQKKKNNETGKRKAKAKGERKKKISQEERKKNSTKNKIQIIIKRLYITTSNNKNRISSYTTLQNSYYLLPTFIKLKRRLIFIHLPTIKDDQNLLVFNKIICFPPHFLSLYCVFLFGFIILIRLNYNKK
ncbi:hypothetical protein MEM_02323 [Candida albicans L26]|uniref:Uncharacterized protein n=2 Tax=Candida albicans TaxID=5476 RepID=Q59X46_CANAL|nr:uncharacterized protein CAALFM_C209240CA [Candida albicans SC5314]KGQ95911.1 hypothetical protein MEU_02313 [Candida albicans P37005]KGR13895.1 hypothetical protein MG3_02329 [Candida albicans P78048]KGR20733.1 hypothetical protein MG9_02325 [Candida albicans P37037]KGT70297.1 hypothetical protein MEK_02323 [Candida albicans 12C]KGU12913.1 hypothetical protein MEY_02328 [Candida albicans 19F]KGU15698.1 hypothetical protein MEM_02323 [Candida albicans L26]KHC58020.1 hypothetical protein MG|eukprot:XP_714256.1 hypothetical protein CAALFM_C209240CA [Candida albicans SC5314]